MACAVGTAASLLVTLLWTTVAGWFFLAFALAALGSSIWKNAALRRWRRRRDAPAFPLRPARTFTLLLWAGSIAGGCAGVWVMRSITTDNVVGGAAFLLGGALVSGPIAFVTSRGFIVRLLRARPPEREASRAEVGFDLQLTMLATALQRAALDAEGWSNVVRRSVATAREAGVSAAQRGDPRLAMRLTLKREHLSGAEGQLAHAWSEVIDAAREGIRAASA